MNAQRCGLLVKRYSAAEMEGDTAIYPFVGDANSHDAFLPQSRDGPDVTVGCIMREQADSHNVFPLEEDGKLRGICRRPCDIRSRHILINSERAPRQRG